LVRRVILIKEECAVILGLGGYRPDQIFKTDREKSRDAKNSRLKVQHAEEDVESAPRVVRPEGEAGLVYDAAEFLYEMEQHLTEIEAAFGAAASLISKALDLKLADTERKAIQRKYRGAINNQERLCTTLKIQGEAVFSGLYSEKPKVLFLNDSGSQELSLLVRNLKPEALGMLSLRIDSIVNARKADKKITEIRKIFSLLKTSLVSKSKFIQTICQSKGIGPFRFGADSEEALRVTAPVVVTAQDLESKAPRLLSLKSRQERVAAAKGRTYALLVNLKI